MSLTEKDAYRMADVAGGLRYASARAEHYRGQWVYIRTGPYFDLRCAWRMGEDGHELAVSRTDRLPDTGDLYLIRQALGRSQLEETGLREVPERKTVFLKLQRTQGSLL